MDAGGAAEVDVLVATEVEDDDEEEEEEPPNGAQELGRFAVSLNASLTVPRVTSKEFFKLCVEPMPVLTVYKVYGPAATLEVMGREVGTRTGTTTPSVRAVLTVRSRTGVPGASVRLAATTVSWRWFAELVKRSRHDCGDWKMMVSWTG